jgi:RND family efflux transporter MFP subunit
MELLLNVAFLAYLGGRTKNPSDGIYATDQPRSTKPAEHGTMRIVKPTTFNHLLILGWILTFVGCNSSKNTYDPPPPPDVTVAPPVRQSITPFLEQNGVIEAVDEAEVRARVRGFLQEVRFEPGQKVAAGDVIYRIEPDEYQAAVNSAKATVASSEAAIAVAEAMVKTAEAELKRATQNLAREKSLMQQGAGSQATLDAAVAATDGAAAALDSAKANVEAAIATKGSSVASLAQAQLDLEYTTVKSPISGRISATDVKRGNLVDNGAKLATVVDRDRVYANFSISDREMLRLMRSERAEADENEELAAPDWRRAKVFLKREGDDGFPFKGVLDYVDQTGIDATTGTLRLRAQFDNPDDGLIPGMFVSVRIPTGPSMEAMLLPEYAVLRDQRGQYVLLVNGERIVERVGVTVDRTISGWAVIAEGLTIDSRVIVDGLQRARFGLPVNPMDRTLEIDDQTLLRGFASSDRSAEVSTDGDSASPSEIE